MRRIADLQCGLAVVAAVAFALVPAAIGAPQAGAKVGPRVANLPPPAQAAATSPASAAASNEKPAEYVGPILPPDDELTLGLTCLLEQQPNQIDLPSALRLAGMQNPQILIARQRVLEAVAIRQLAAAQLLPSLNSGMDYDNHNGNLQQSSGNILTVNRNSLYVGAGTAVFAAGTINIPGLYYDFNVSEALFGALMARQVVERRQFESRARENETLRDVAMAYNQLLAAEAFRAVRWRILQETAEMYRLTKVFAEKGQGRAADADRAAAAFHLRRADYIRASGRVLVASTRLAFLLSLPPEVELCPMEQAIIPASIVPDPMPLCELIAIAVMNRPELMANQAGIRQAMLQLHGAKVLPFSPNVIIGLSYGNFGGGSDLVAAPLGSSTFGRSEPRFGNFGYRSDFDAVAYWTLQNMGVGNKALIRLAQVDLKTADLEMMSMMDRVRDEVASAYARVHARFAAIATAEKAVTAIQQSFKADMEAIRGGLGLPIELLDSLRLLARSREEYLNAIVAYNQAQIEIFVALGNPPADVLARPVPREDPAPAAK